MSSPQLHDTHELDQLLELLFEDRLTADDAKRLESIVLADAQQMQQYIDAINLHGNLYWDAAGGMQEASILAEPEVAKGSQSNTRRAFFGSTAFNSKAAAVLSACLLVGFAIGWAFFGQPAINPAGPDNIAENNTNDGSGGNERTDNPPKEQLVPVPIDLPPALDVLVNNDPAHDSEKPGPPGLNQNDTQRSTEVASSVQIVATINEQLRLEWEAHKVQASDVAKDSEWVRRVYLDLAGRIPSLAETESFLANSSAEKRTELVEGLLKDGQFARHWTGVWSNLLIGRVPRNNVNQMALREYLHEQFTENRPWSETVSDIIAAEGNPNTNGEANFLVAHLNNQAVPATAVTCRLFLGMQIQCTQCHNHPFNDWKQQDFWELNSFFKQTTLERNEPASEKKAVEVKLVSRNVGGPTFFESRNGIMKVAYPKFSGKEIDDDASVNRRSELARILSDINQSQMAASMVNRVWAHLMGFGFVNPVDDMGPHNPPTHPELLNFLTEQFIHSNYDVQELVRWITASDAYQLTSRFNDNNNSIDNPEVGEPPIFSRVYMKPMSAEQIYESLLVASQSDQPQRKQWARHLEERDKWVRQFFRLYRTEENDEDNQINGTIPQALELMNGTLVRSALNPDHSDKKATGVIAEVIDSKSSDAVKIRKLCLAALSRNPTSREISLFKKYVQERVRKRGGSVSKNVALAEGLQDVYWAYLNSNEFVLVP